jgi:RimJ/RimL family protein N-acetyltransferase
MDIRPFHVEHLKALKLQPSQRQLGPSLNEEVYEFLSTLDAYTAFAPDGEPLACAGLMDIWPGRAMVWSFISENAGRHMVGVTRAVRQFLDLKAPRRIEAYVDADFPAGHRWIEMLGFTREGYLHAFRPDGGDQILYSKVRNG